jgi:hypothetical protein
MQGTLSLARVSSSPSTKEDVLRLLLITVLLALSTSHAQEPAPVEQQEAMDSSEEVPADEALEEAPPLVEEAAEAAAEEEAIVDEVPAADEVPASPEVEGALETPEEVAETVQVLVSSARDGNWIAVAAAAIMVGVWILRTFLLTSIRKDWIPYITVGVGVVSALASQILNQDILLAEAGPLFLSGVITGLASIGAWEVLGKKLLRKATMSENPSSE